MALDAQTGTASAPADTTAASAPAAGNPDTITLPRSQYETILREHGSLKAAEPFRSWGQKLGINDPNKFKDWEPIHQAITERRMTHAEAAALLRGQQATQAHGDDGGDKPLTRAELTAATDKLQTGYRGELARVSAMGDHKLSLKQQDTMRTKILTDVLGEKPTQAEKDMFELATEGWFNKNQRFYPEGHPLAADEYQPHDEKSLAPLGEMLKGFRARAEAEGAVQLGEATIAGRGKTPSAAGATPASGKPEQSGQSSRPGGKPSAAVVNAAYDARVKARGRAPM